LRRFEVDAKSFTQLLQAQQPHALSETKRAMRLTPDTAAASHREMWHCREAEHRL